MFSLLLTFTILTTTPDFEVFKVPDEYIESAYAYADAILNTEDDDEEIIEEDVPVEESPEEEISEEVSESDITVLTDGSLDGDILEELKKSNEYWDMFLDSFEIVDSQTLYPPSITTDFNYRFSSSGVLTENTNNFCCGYVMPLDYGTYTINFHYFATYSGIRIGVVPSLEYGSTSISGFYNLNSVDDYSFSFSVTQPCFLIASFSSSGSSVSTSGPVYKTLGSLIINRTFSYFDSYTLSEIGNSLVTIKDKVDKLTQYNNYELYEDESTFESSDMYINKYQYETYKLLRYLVIFAACQIGMFLTFIFSWRLRRGNS